MSKTSARQREILDFIRRFIRQHNLPPTVRDIQKGCNISSTSVVDYNLHILRREGHIRRLPDVARGIELVDETPTRRARPRVPLMGYIAAGQPLPVPTAEGWVDQEPLENLELPPEMLKGKSRVYALQVRGSSMIDALVDDGDIVLIEPARTANNGDMVVARIPSENEVTLKRIYQEGPRVRLQPANSQMQPIYVSADDIEVQGRVIGVLRLLE